MEDYSEFLKRLLTEQRKKLSPAFNQGKSDFIAGKKHYDNPFKPNSQYWNEWNAGRIEEIMDMGSLANG